MNEQGRYARERPLQFSLSHLFVLTTAASLLFGADQLFGPFRTSLMLGLLVIGVAISLARIENMILGGLSGVVLAVLILMAASLLSTFQQENGLGGKLLCAAFLYPLYGYLVGVFCTTDRTMDSDSPSMFRVSPIH